MSQSRAREFSDIFGIFIENEKFLCILIGGGEALCGVSGSTFSVTTSKNFKRKFNRVCVFVHHHPSTMTKAKAT